MAIYGADVYGNVKYSGDQSVSYGVEPFVATATSLTGASISWSDPGGNWSKFRIMSSRAGYPSHITDGRIVYEIAAGSGTFLSYEDEDLAGGWHYYAIFLYNPTTSAWVRAGLTDVMIPYDYRSTDLLWSTIPEFYRNIQSTTADYSDALYQINPAIYLSNDYVVPNEQLRKFLSIFGWGVDILRSQVDSILDTHNPHLVHVSRLALLAEQFGSVVETSVPASNNRAYVKNMGLLYRKRGTREALEETIRLATGWEVEIIKGRNMMLNLDQAEITHPVIPVWSSTSTYFVNDIVSYNGRHYRCLVNHINQTPPTSGTNNTYWNSTDFDESYLVRTSVDPITNEVSTWQVGPHGSTPIASNPGNTYVALGVPDPSNTSVDTTALAVTAVAGETRQIGVMSVPHSTDAQQWRENAIKYGIPVPLPAQWDASRTYDVGDIVYYQGLPYEARKKTTALPTDTAEWDSLGVDRKIALTLSFYSHGPFTAAGGAASPSIPLWHFFDEQGKRLHTVSTDTGGGSVLQGSYDPFVNITATNNVLTEARTMVIGGGSWGNSTTRVGTPWRVARDAEGGYAYPVDSTLTWSAGGLDVRGHVAVTFRKIPSVGEVGVMWWRVDNNNFYAATNKGFYRYISGSRTSYATWPEGTFKDGDRIFVAIEAYNGQAGDARVYKQGKTLADTATLLFTYTMPAQTFTGSGYRSGVISWT